MSEIIDRYFATLIDRLADVLEEHLDLVALDRILAEGRLRA